MKKFLCVLLAVLMSAYVCSCFGKDSENNLPTTKYNIQTDMLKKYSDIVKKYQNEYGRMSLLEYKTVQNKALGGVCFLGLYDFDKNGLNELLIAWLDNFDSNGFANYNLEIYKYNKDTKKAESVLLTERVFQSQLHYNSANMKPYSSIKIVTNNEYKYVVTGDGHDEAIEYYGYSNGKIQKSISFLQSGKALFVNDEQVSEDEYNLLLEKWSATDSNNSEEYPLSPIKTEKSNGYNAVKSTIDITNKTLTTLGLSISSISFNNNTEATTKTTTTTTEITTTKPTTTTQTVTDDTRGAIEYTGEYVTYYGKKASDTAPCYGVNIESVESGYITFTVFKLGRNASPYYVTDLISARLKNNKASFSWKDSWSNKGKGTITISKSIVTINMEETKTAEGNRSSLSTDGDLKLYKK